MDEVATTEVQNEKKDYELILLAVFIIAAILLAYRNRTMISEWFNDLTGKFS
jgi:hypothetical protein